MPKSKIFFWLLASFIAGVAAASFLPVSLQHLAAVFVFGGAVALFGLLQPARRGHLAVTGFCLMVAAAGMLRFLAVSRPPPALPGAVGERVMLVGAVSAEPRRHARSQSVVVSEEGTGAKVLVRARPYPGYRYGDVLELVGRLERPENFSADFDYAAYLARDDIYLTMAFPEVRLTGSGQGGWLRSRLFAIKGAFVAAVNRRIPEPKAAFLNGLLLGERSSFPPELEEALRRTGTSHLVALSGYNITVIADNLLRLLTVLWLPLSWAFAIAATGIVLFVVLAGAEASVVRAAAMGVLVLIARYHGRPYRVRNALALAAAGMLAANPKLFRFDVGFQLSFLATLGLLYAAPILGRYAAALRRTLIPPPRSSASSVKPAASGIVVTTLAAQLAVLPLLVYRFGTLSLVAPLANLAAIPLIPATMLFGFLTGMAGLVADWLGRLPAAVSSLLLGYELAAITAFAGMPASSLEIPGLKPAAAIAAYAALGYWVWREVRRGRAPRRGIPHA